MYFPFFCLFLCLFLFSISTPVRGAGEGLSSDRLPRARRSHRQHSWGCRSLGRVSTMQAYRSSSHGRASCSTCTYARRTQPLCRHGNEDIRAKNKDFFLSTGRRISSGEVTNEIGQKQVCFSILAWVLGWFVRWGATVRNVPILDAAREGGDETRARLGGGDSLGEELGKLCRVMSGRATRAVWTHGEKTSRRQTQKGEKRVGPTM